LGLLQRQVSKRSEEEANGIYPGFLLEKIHGVIVCLLLIMLLKSQHQIVIQSHIFPVWVQEK